MTDIVRISDLEAELKAFREKHGDLRVAGTWESITTPVEVLYRTKPGLNRGVHVASDESLCVLLVEEDDIYRTRYEHPDDR